MPDSGGNWRAAQCSPSDKSERINLSAFLRQRQISYTDRGSTEAHYTRLSQQARVRPSVCSPTTCMTSVSETFRAEATRGSWNAAAGTRTLIEVLSEWGPTPHSGAR